MFDQTQFETANTAGAQENWRLLHTMLRVSDLEKSIQFYANILGMRLMRREEYPEGRFSLAFIGYGNENDNSVLELTHNWDTQQYVMGTAFGHVALEVADIYAASAKLKQAGVAFLREPGPMTFGPSDGSERDSIAFIADPDGYRIELIQAVKR